MPDGKISPDPNLASPAVGDQIPIVDINVADADKNKTVTWSQIVSEAQTQSITGLKTFAPTATGAMDSYDAIFGDVSDYGMIWIGNAHLGRTNHTSGYNMDGAFIIHNEGGPVTGDIEFAVLDSSDLIRFALPKSGVGNATYNPRSLLLAGPAIADSDIVTVGYWQGLGSPIFTNLACDTAGSGADLGVQNDLEVEGDIFTDSILESTTDAGVTIDSLLIKDGAISATSHVHSTFDRATSVESGATVFSNIVVLDGITTGIATREFAHADLASIPAAAHYDWTAGTQAGFHSLGIDDNANGERLQIADTKINFGTAGATYQLFHAANDQILEIFGSNSSGTGGAIRLFGGAHGSQAGDFEFKSQSNVLQLWYDDSASKWDFRANDIETDGDFIVGTSGKGIDFSATADGTGSATSELLDDYEEGTFTATLDGIGGGGTPIDVTAYYTKVGNQVTTTVDFLNGDTTGMTGILEVTGYPYTAARVAYGALWCLNIVGTEVGAVARLTGTKVEIGLQGSGTLQDVSAGAARYLRMTHVYHV